jgi:hypothetical protein
MISRLRLAAVAISAAAAASPAAATATVGQPPAALFRSGYDLCRAAPLAAIRKAGGQHYRAGRFSNGVCSWERGDLRAGIALSTHPSSVGLSLMRSFIAQSGKHHITARRIRIPHAAKAVVVTLPAGQPGRFSKYLFAAYAAGVVQVDMTAPGSLPNTRLVRVLTLVSRA